MIAPNKKSFSVEDASGVLAAMESPPENEPSSHDENLAETLDDTTLSLIQSECETWLDRDEESRLDWYRREAEGIRMLGAGGKPLKDPPFPGASEIVHPMMMEAGSQFQSRSIIELWPPVGPAKAIVLGDKTEEKTKRAKRVGGFINYHLTQLIPGAYEKHDQMLFRLSLSGSMFKRTFYDPTNEEIRQEVVPPRYFVVPYTADEDLANAYRYTHIRPMDTRQVRARVNSGEFRKLARLDPPMDEELDTPSGIVKKEEDDTEGREYESWDDDARHMICYMHCYIDLDNPTIDGSQEESELLPYIVVFERYSGEVYSITRDWEDGDETYKRKEEYQHYKMFPGIGFYGFGYYHILGSLTRAASGSINAILDAAADQNNSRGFVSSLVKLDETNNGPVGLNEWRSVNATAEDLAKAFFKLPSSTPSPVLKEMLAHLEELAYRLGSTMDSMVGAGQNNVPVGTTLARIEQGMKPYTAAHARLHKVQGKELKQLYGLIRDHMPDYYPYSVEGETRLVKRTDFADDIEVVPVSDPNVVTMAQKLHLGEYVKELADSAPDLYDRRHVHEQILTAIRWPDVENTLRPAPEDQTRRIGPVEEFMAIMTGRPVKAYPEQDHQAHTVVHQGQSEILQQQGNSEQAAVMAAHIREHQSWSYYLMMQAQLAPVGVVLTPGMMGDDRDENQPETSPEQENLVAVMVAQATIAMQAQPAPGPDPAEVDAARKAEEQDAAAQADIARQDAKVQADIARQDAKTTADIGLKVRAQEAEMQRRTIEGIAEEQQAREQAGVQPPRGREEFY